MMQSFGKTTGKFLAFRATYGALGRLPAGALRLALVAAVAGAIGACTHVMPSPVGMTAASTISVTYNSAAPFSVGIIPDRAPPVHIGDQLGFTLSSSDAGYGHLYLPDRVGAPCWCLPRTCRWRPVPRTDSLGRTAPSSSVRSRRRAWNGCCSW